MMMVQQLLFAVCISSFAFLVSAQSGASLQDSQLAFADRIVDDLYQDNDDENQCSSALGVSMMMSLLYPAMTDEARTQMQTVFGYPDVEGTLVWANITNDINSRYDGACFLPDECSLGAKPLVSITNSVWIQEGSTVDANYAATLGSLLFPIDFSSDTAGAEVNDWVDQATKGVIDSIVDDGPLPSTVVLISINAIYLKASWLKPFSFSRTSQDMFYAPDKSTVQRETAIFMHQMDYFAYSSTAVSNYQIIQLPFIETLSMILAVPIVKNAPLTTALAVVSALPQLERQRIGLGLPKFQFEKLYQDDLQTALRNAGVVLPFAGGHLCIFENDCQPALDIVLQKTFISVDELGVEAAAVTAGISTTSLPVDTPVEVMADLPFQFFIFDSVTTTVLFEGRVVDPTPQNTTAEFTAKHTDADFWSANFPADAVRVFDDSPVAVAPSAPTLSPVTVVAPVNAPMPVAASTPMPVAAPMALPIPSPTSGVQVAPIPALPTPEGPASAAISIANMTLTILFMVVLPWIV